MVTMRWLALCALVAGCFHDDLVPCGDHVCPTTSTCVAGVCATPDQLDACRDHADGDRCTTMASSGVCANGVCIIAVCGNGKVEAPEVCDDGNPVGGDGCSELCDSNETCGNGVVDYREGEQCDDGGFRSGDGCASACKVEIDLWRDVTAIPPARIGPAVTFDRDRGRVVLFGGASQAGSTSETWEWNGLWNRIATPVSPPARTGAKLAYDPLRRRVVLFGGVKQGTFLGDTWEYDGVTWSERTPAVSPTPRTDFGFAYDAVNHEIVLFGGLDGTFDLLGDTWTYDGTAWTERHPSTSPAPSNGATMAFDTAHGYVLLFDSGQTYTWSGTNYTVRAAGPPSLALVGLASRSDGIVMYGGLFSNSNATSSTYLWNGMGWSQLSPTSLPPASYGDTLVSYLNNVVAYVPGVPPTQSADVWTLTPGTGDGVWSSVAAREPADREQAAIAFDRERGRAVMFGGSVTGTNSLADTWEWDGNDWLPRALQGVPPPPRYLAGMAFDEDDGMAYLYGGAGSPTILRNDLLRWSSDDGMWTLENLPAPRPPAGVAAMVYVATSHSMLITPFPSAGQVVPIDTWKLEPGVGYTQLAPAHQPRADVEPKLAYDRARDRVVFYTYRGTWEWDGTDWTDRTLPGGPRVYGGSLAYDETLERVLLFGGAEPSAAVPTNVTYAWDGTTWSVLTPALSPSGRFDAAMVFDPVLNRMLIAGGAGQNAALGFDTWAYGFESARPTETCIDHDTDGDGLVGCADPDCAARCASCGDTLCSPLEDYLLCPADCPAP